MPIFSHRLKIIEATVIVTDPEPYPVAYLRIEKVELEAKTDWIMPSLRELRELLKVDDMQDGLDDEGRGDVCEVDRWEKSTHQPHSHPGSAKSIAVR
jgi:hypothetical protein